MSDSDERRFIRQLTGAMPASIKKPVHPRQWRIVRSARGLFAQVHPSPVFILGNQKAGTTAIAAIIAKASGNSVALDLRREIPVPHVPAVLDGSLSMADFIHLHRVDFARPIIKEPGLTLLHAQLAQVFPESKFVFIARDPRENLRSVLNRLDLPGDRSTLDEHQLAALTQTWSSIVFGDSDPTTTSYVESLAARWDKMARIYLEHSATMTLVRYEDFVADKPAVIGRTLDALGLEARSDPSALFEKQFQSRGTRSGAVDDFFGSRNLEIIEATCADSMKRLGYP